MKKLFALLLTCSMITCVFSACGDEESGTSGTPDTNSGSSVSESESSSEEKAESSSESIAESSSEAEASTADESSEDSSEIKTESGESETEQDSESKSESESETESEVSEAIKEKVVLTPGTAGDENLIGTWTNDEMSASFSSIKFGENGVISAVIDCSTIMSISGENLLMSGTECPYDFDGTVFSCVITSEDMGIDDSESPAEEMSILEMTKLEPGDKSDMNGTYILNGGLLNDIYSEALPVESDIYIKVSNNSNIIMEVAVCGYDADGKNISWKGDTEALLGIASDEAITPYKVEGDTLTISGSTEEILTRNKDID